MYERTALPDGPRVITSRLPGARSVSIAAYVLAGSRLESAEEAGAAHFMEHITFKGTAAYPTTRAVSEAIEGVGGSFNAATDRESTVYWVRVPLREVARGMDVLGELIVRPLLRGEEIESERAVIVEEIRSYLDDPGEHVHTLFDLAMFGDTPLGREIAGSEESVRGLPQAEPAGLLGVRLPAGQRRRLGRGRHLARRDRGAGRARLRDGRGQPLVLRPGAGAAGRRSASCPCGATRHRRSSASGSRVCAEMTLRPGHSRSLTPSSAMA